MVVTGQKRNGKSAFVLEVVVGGLLSWENPKDCGALESDELPKGELLTVLLACPNKNVGATVGGFEAEVVLLLNRLLLPPPLPAETLGTAALEELEFRKLNADFVVLRSEKSSN